MRTARGYTYRAFQPAAVRRRRRAKMATCAVLTVCGSAMVATDLFGGPTPRSLDAAAIQATQFGPRVVVYSLPARGGSHGSSHGGGSHGGSHGGDSGSKSDSGGGSDSGSGDGSGSGSSGDSSSGSSGDSGASSNGSSSVSPQILDGPSGSASVTNINPQGTTTITNGQAGSDGTNGSSSAGGTTTQPLASGPVGATGGADAQGGQVWPPLATQNGTAQTTPPSPTVEGAPATGGSAALPTTSPLAATAPTAVASPPLTGAAAGTASPAAQVLMQVQCPQAQPGLLCFQAASVSGALAQLPATGALPNLPVVSSPGLTNPCPTSGASTASPSTSAPDSSSGSSSGSSGDSSGDSGSGSGSGSHSGSGKKSHARDSAAIIPDSSAASSTTPTASQCGLLGQTTSGVSQAAAGVGQAAGGVSNDLSSLLQKSGKKISLTGYSFQDNTPPGSAKVSCPQIASHNGKAGGTGTYQDPLTVASDGSNGSAGQFGVKCGSRFYVVNLKRYVIVEDTGNTPDKNGIHLDTWVADDPNKTCMNKITGDSEALPDPPPGLPVLAGPIGSNGSCLLPGSSSGSGSSGGGQS